MTVTHSSQVILTFTTDSSHHPTPEKHGKLQVSIFSFMTFLRMRCFQRINSQALTLNELVLISKKTAIRSSPRSFVWIHYNENHEQISRKPITPTPLLDLQISRIGFPSPRMSPVLVLCIIRL